MVRRVVSTSSYESVTKHKGLMYSKVIIRDQKSNKQIADGYTRLFRAFKREAVQFLVAKSLAVIHFTLEVLPAVQT